MGKAFFEITMSLDGFVAGRDQTLEQPLGQGGERLHEWMTRLASWRKQHSLEGGETNGDTEIVEESRRRTGAFLMGRRMFSGGAGPWEDDPNADGWWGDDPPFRAPVVVLTHHAREPVEKQAGTTYIFVTEGIEAAVEQARAAAGDRDVAVVGGADVGRQALRAGLVGELLIHVAPLLLGGGVRLFAGLGPDEPKLESTEVIESPAVTHLRYHVVK